MPTCNHPAGTSCHCNSSEPCITALKVDSPHQSQTIEVDGYGENIHEIAPLQDNKEQPVAVNISLIGSCQYGNANCPSGVLVDEDGNLVQELSASQSVKLAYKRSQSMHFIPLLDSFRFICLESSAKSLPSSNYYIRVNQCGDKPPEKGFFASIWDSIENTVSNTFHEVVMGEVPFSDMSIGIHPTYIWDAEINFGWNKDERQKHAEQVEKEDNKPAKGKSINKIAKYIRAGFTVGGAIKINEGGYVTEYKTKDYKHTVKEVKEPKKHTGDLGNLLSDHGESDDKPLDQSDDKASKVNLLKSISEIVEIFRMCMYTAPGNDKVKLISYDYEPPAIKISAHGETGYKDKLCGIDKAKTTLAFAPLLNVSIKLDLLLALAAYFGVGNAAARFKSELKKLEDAYKKGDGAAYAGVDLNVILTGVVNLNGSLSKNLGEEIEPNFSFEEKLTLAGIVNLRAEAKVWIIHGVFKFEAKAQGTVCCTIETVKKHGVKTLDFILYHDGITADVEITISGDVKDDKKSKKAKSFKAAHNSEKKKEKGYHKKGHWVWVEPISKDDSDWRVSLLTFDEDA